MNSCRNVLLASAATLALAASPAGASIIPAFVGASLGGDGLYDYTYTAELSADQEIDVGASLTIHNFGTGATLDSASGFLASGFAFSTSGADVTFTCTSCSEADGLLSSTFTLDSAIGPNTQSGTFDAAAFKNAPGAPLDETATFNGGFVAVPSATAVPEPTGLALLLTGLLGLTGLRLQRNRS